jgi:Zn-dependent protease with chaperone function
MAVAPTPGGRATLDFFGAQAQARRRTAVLVVSFGLAVCVVVAVVYAALLLVAPAVVPRSDLPLAQVPLHGVVPGWEAPVRLFQPALLLAAAAGVASVTGLGAAWHAARLSAGGGEAVAQMLGGVPVDRGTADPAERRLVNVVEEMAIAAGLPVPRLYLLPGEAGINAFAAGYTPGHSVMAVTRGALDRLTRDELQGVVAHELSHVLNADTRVDLRLMAAVGGLTVLALLGRVVLRGTSSSRSRDSRGSGAALIVGLALLLAGAFGALCGRLVRYAVARQREWLADASAVQFTRNPDGLAGALRKIAEEGSALRSPHAPEAAHIFFASAATGFFSSLLSTHPPIEERIRRLAPHAAALAAAAAAPPPLRAAAPAAGAAAAPPRLAFRPAPEHLPLATGLIDGLPATLSAAAREPFGAGAIACALLLGDAPDLRERQLLPLARRDAALAAETRRLAAAAEGVSPADRMALLELTLPALDALSPAQAAGLQGDLAEIAAAGGTATPFQLAVRRALLRRLERDAGAPPRPSVRLLGDVEPECLEVLSALAWSGGRDQAAAQAALDAGVRSLGVRSPWRLLPRDRVGTDRLDAALLALDGAAPAPKARLLEACVATALADAQVTAEEAEVVRAVSAALGLAMPPVLEGRGAPGA